MRSRWPAAAVTAALVLLAPQAAYAATLTDGAVTTAASTTVYDLRTTTRAWSAVAVHSPDRWNLSLFSGGGGWLASSTYPDGRTEFVAVNSFQRPLGPYRAEATRILGGRAHVQWKQANNKIVLPVPANDGVSGAGDADITFVVLPSTQVVNVYNAYLNAGEAFWVNTRPDSVFYYLQTNPYDPATTVLSRAQAVSVPGMRVVGNCTLYTARFTGWHGMLIVGDAPPVTTVPGSGIAVALHRFDPARPDTCPHRNFPDPTPPGP